VVYTIPIKIINIIQVTVFRFILNLEIIAVDFVVVEAVLSSRKISRNIRVTVNMIPRFSPILLPKVLL